MAKRSKAWRDRQRHGSAAHLAPHECLNCGGAGPHFCPPSLGEPGFYACAKLER